MRILLLDDDDSMVIMAREWLTRAGHDVVALTDFQAAQNYLALNQPDALITDVRLGAFNGMQLLIFAKMQHPTMRAVAMTGFDDPMLRAEADRVGALFLVKPVTGFDLERALTANGAAAASRGRPH